jgi:hypothetical protein
MDQKSELVITIVIFLLLGVGVLVGLNSPDVLFHGVSSQVSPASVLQAETSRSTPITTTGAAGRSTAPASNNVAVTGATATLPALRLGQPVEADQTAMLVLYNSRFPSNFAVDICAIAEFYGVQCDQVDLKTQRLTDKQLRNSLGDYYPLVAIDAKEMFRPYAIPQADLYVLQRAVATGGFSLYIGQLNSQTNVYTLRFFTSDTLQSINAPIDSTRDWIVTNDLPQIAREFSGQTIRARSLTPQHDNALMLAPQAIVRPIIQSTDDNGNVYTTFGLWQMGAGKVFLDASEEMGPSLALGFEEYYFNPYYFSQILPAMMTIRYTYGDAAWHNNWNYANLTIDGASLVEPYNQLSYYGLLNEMKAHNFHTTIALIPNNYRLSEPEVVGLFLANPDRFSLAQLGNSHSANEFYRLAEPASHRVSQGLPADPQVALEWDVSEGLARMLLHQQNTGISFSRVMIFPGVVPPEPVLTMLKERNYLGTVNASEVQMDSGMTKEPNRLMSPAVLQYETFPIVTRRSPGTYRPFRADPQPFLFDLFIDKPGMAYTRAASGEMFDNSVADFDPVADALNSMTTGVHWSGLEAVFHNLYRQRTNTDGSISVKMFSSQLHIRNDSSMECSYHLSKPETRPDLIRGVTVNGQAFSYRIVDGELLLDVIAPARVPMDVSITYGNK